MKILALISIKIHIFGKINNSTAIYNISFPWILPSLFSLLVAILKFNICPYAYHNVWTNKKTPKYFKSFLYTLCWVKACSCSHVWE